MPFRFGLPPTRAGRAACESTTAGLQKAVATTTAVSAATDKSRRMRFEMMTPSPRRNADTQVPCCQYFTIASMRYTSWLLAILFGVGFAPLHADQRQNARPQPAPVMEFFEVHEQSIVDLQAAQTAGRVTAKGLVDSYLARIQAYDQAGPRLNSIVLLNPRAREDAEALDRERAAKGPRGPLHGIPVLVDRKSTRLNSSHLVISYAVFCLKKK